MTRSYLQQIPEPGNDINSIVTTLRALREVVHAISANASGVSNFQFFAPSSSVGKCAAIAATTSDTEDATAQFTLASPTDVVVMFSLLSVQASAAGTLIVAVDGEDLTTTPLAISGGNALPQSAFTFIGNLGKGPHAISVRTSTGLTGLSIGVIGSTR